MKSSQQHTDVARALSAALEPLIDVCLQIGITSPEIESLLRATFVHRAFVKLPRHSRTGRGPSDSRVSLAAGVHRSEVSRIRAAGGAAGAKGTMEKKQRLYSKSARVLVGWTTDPRFMTSGGHPSTCRWNATSSVVASRTWSISTLRAIIRAACSRSFAAAVTSTCSRTASFDLRVRRLDRAASRSRTSPSPHAG